MKAIFFDLDNTLYDTEEYYSGAFGDISEYLTKRYNIDRNESNQFLMKTWKKRTSVYPNLFNDLLVHYNLKEDVKTIVEIFNQHPIKTFQLYPDAIPTLQKLKHDGYKIGIITDGNKSRQKRKIESCSLQNLIDDITYTKDLEPKPSIIPFIIALNKMKIKSVDAMYVADNPIIDFKGAKKIGIITTRILRGEFMKIKGDNDIDHIINSLNEIWEVIGK